MDKVRAIKDGSVHILIGTQESDLPAARRARNKAMA